MKFQFTFDVADRQDLLEHSAVNPNNLTFL